MSDHNERACTKCGSLLHHEDACPPRPEGPPEGEALNRPPIGSVVKVAGLSDWPIKVTAHTERGFAYSGGKPFDIPRLGIWGDGTGEVYLDGPDVSWSFFHLPAPATEPPATGATPETDAAWEAAPPADHGGMTAMRRCSESLETRLHAAEAEVRRLKELDAIFLRNFEAKEKELAHARMYSEARDTKIADLRAQLQTALDAQQKAEGEIESLTLQLQKAEVHSDHALSELVMKHAATIARLTEERDEYESALDMRPMRHDREIGWVHKDSLEKIATLRAKLALADGLAEAASFYAGRKRADGNGYEFDKEPTGITGDVARSALDRYRAASVPPAATGHTGTPGEGAGS